MRVFVSDVFATVAGYTHLTFHASFEIPKSHKAPDEKIRRFWRRPIHAHLSFAIAIV